MLCLIQAIIAPHLLLIIIKLLGKNKEGFFKNRVIWHSINMLYDIAFKDVPWCTRTEEVHGEHAKPGGDPFRVFL